MIYSAFVALVVEELGVDGNRRGIETQRARWIRDAVIDLQRFIRAYRAGHTTTYQVADLTEKGYAHLGSLPDQAKPKAFYIVSTGDTVEEGTTDNPDRERNRLDYVAWENRLDRMIRNGSATVNCNGLTVGASEYLYSISPFSRQFLVHPLVNDETYLLLVWDGLKMAFEDADVVPWPQWAAEAVASYVKWKILKYVDKRPDLAREEYGAYVARRLSLWREQNEAQVADGRDEEYADGADPAPGTVRSQAGSTTLAIGNVSKAIVFPDVFDVAPIVDCWIVPPDSTAFVITADPDGSTITTAGFTALFAGAIPAAGYVLMWTATPPTT